MVCSQQCLWDWQAQALHYESLLMADYYPVRVMVCSRQCVRGWQAEELHYYETLLMVCERVGCPEGAATYAQAAVCAIKVAYPAKLAD
jgi:hypothetical protein